MGRNFAMRKCEYCDDSFMPASNVQRFCTVECRKDAYRHGRPRYEPKPCDTCGKEFTPKTNFATCCSQACYSTKWYKDNPEAIVMRDEQISCRMCLT